MKTSYHVTWRRSDGEPKVARLAVEAASVVLTTLEPAASYEIALDEIVAVELRHPADEANPILVLESSAGDTIELKTPVDRWIVADLVEHLFVRGLARRGRRRILLALKLTPGMHDSVRELLQGGPPFDPGETPLTLHEVFLLDDEALFLFEADADVESVVEPNFWQAIGAWRELIAGARLAELVYSWRREGQPASEIHGPGLGF